MRAMTDAPWFAHGGERKFAWFRFRFAAGASAAVFFYSVGGIPPFRLPHIRVSNTDIETHYHNALHINAP